MTRVLTCLFPLFMLSACAAPATHQYLLTERGFAPTAHVETLISWPENREYLQIARLEITNARATSDQDILALLLERAKRLGADAIVWGANPGNGATQVPTRGPLAAGFNSEVKNHAVAIKYLP